MDDPERSINQKFTVNMMIKRVKCWCLALYITHIPYYRNINEKGIESAAGKTGQDAM
jgi:hypothetical protein